MIRYFIGAVGKYFFVGHWTYFEFHLGHWAYVVLFGTFAMDCLVFILDADHCTRLLYYRY